MFWLYILIESITGVSVLQMSQVIGQCYDTDSTWTCGTIVLSTYNIIVWSRDVARKYHSATGLVSSRSRFIPLSGMSI